MTDVIDQLQQHERTGTPDDASAELTVLQASRIAEDIRRQPAWRRSSDKAAAYYHGKQIDADVAQELEERGMGPLIANFVKPAINAVLGLEAKTRSDWRVVADDDAHQEVAEALSVKLTEAERETHADNACSNAYADQIIAGLGWGYVGRNANPFKYPYKVQAIHRNEMSWDWSASEYDLSDARYVARSRWYPVDQLAQHFPSEKHRIMAIGSGWSPEWMDIARERGDAQLMFDFDTEQSSGASWIDSEWRNIESGLTCVRELWYRRYVRGLVLKLPDGRVVEFDRRNPAHALAVAQGIVTPQAAVYDRLRVSLWLGPHKLTDDDYGRQALPYVPFWGYREDDTRVPYGIVRDMIPMQDEINARRRKLLWLLSSKRVLADSDALDKAYNDFGDLAREVARPDSVLILNPGRRNANAINIENDLNLSTQQYQVMMESQEAIQRVSGIFNAMLGNDSGAKSGTAIAGLVDQGTTMQGDINDNYRTSRTLVGQRLLELITQDMAGREVRVVAGEEGNRKTIILLNKPAVDPATGVEYRENDVSRALVKVALNDVPSTPAYRAQAMTMIAEVLKGLPPELQAPLVPYFLESTDLPKRKEMAELLRKTLGLDGDQPPDPEKQQMAAAIQELQQVIAQGQQEYEGQIAELQQKVSEQAAALANRQAELSIKAMSAQADAEKSAAETEKIRAETMRARADTATRVIAARQPQDPPGKGTPAGAPVAPSQPQRG